MIYQSNRNMTSVPNKHNKCSVSPASKHKVKRQYICILFGFLFSIKQNISRYKT